MDSKRPLGVTIFGVANLAFGFIFLASFFIFFLLSVVIGWVTDRQFYGFLDWFFLAIIDRFLLAIFYIFSFQLFCSGISLLHMKQYSRKLALTSSYITALSYLFSILLSIISANVYPQIEIDFNSPRILGLYVFLVYTILLTIYLNDPVIKREFNDIDVKLSFKKPILIILIAFIFPLILRLIFICVDWFKRL